MTETSYAQIPAGWYPDPRGSKQRRWWDGSSWTHALEALPETSTVAPAYANLPGPQVARTPSASAPTVARAIDAEPSEHFPTRRQLRDAAAVIETQKQFSESEAGENYSMGPAVSATQKPAASFSVEQFRNVAEQTPTEQLTKAASQVTKSPAISTASSAPVSSASVSSASVTGSPVSAVPQTHTFNAQPATAAEAVAAATVTAAVAEEADIAAPAAAKPFDASDFTNPVIPVNPSAQAAKALAAATAAAAAKSGAAQPGGASARGRGSDANFVPVMRTGAPATRTTPTQVVTASSALQGDPEYQPFGMTPRITTGVVERPTSVNTGSVWLITVMPLLFLGAAYALIAFAPEFYTQFIQGGLAFIVVMASFALAIRDRHQLTLRSHQSTASPAWIFLTPVAYLVARAVFTSRQAGRGWAPAIVFVFVALAAAAGVYFGALPITAFFAPA